MSNIAYISNNRDTGIMESLGMDAFYFEDKSRLESQIRELKFKQYILIYIAEEIYAENKQIIDSFNADFAVTITVLPDALKSTNVGQQRLVNILEDAVGFHVE